MTNDSISSAQIQFDGEAKMVAEGSAGTDERLFDAWFDPIEHAVRDRVRSLEKIFCARSCGRDQCGCHTGLSASTATSS